MKMRNLLLLALMGLSACDLCKPSDSRPPTCPTGCYLRSMQKTPQDGYGACPYTVYRCEFPNGLSCTTSASSDMGTTSSPPDGSVRPDL